MLVNENFVFKSLLPYNNENTKFPLRKHELPDERVGPVWRRIWPVQAVEGCRWRREERGHGRVPCATVLQEHVESRLYLSEIEKVLCS